MQYSTNFNLNKPERADQYNLDHWNQNTDIIDSELNALKNITDDTLKTALLNFCYPIGSIYWSSNSTDPASLFGGTWVQIKDRFVLACGDTYSTTGATGGASSVTLSVSNMPSHNHTFTPSGTIKMNSHSHGLNNHTHSFSWSGSHSHSISHRHIYAFNRDDSSTYGSYTYSTGANTYGNKNTNKSGQFAWTSEPRTGGSSSSLGSEASNSGSSTISISTSTGGNLGNTTSTTSTGSFSGTQGTTSSNGSGTAFNILPPYVVKYCWERTA